MGLTTKDADEARSFVDACHVPWPCGHGVGSRMPVLAGVASRVVVVGSDGRVLWLHRDDTDLTKATADAVELGLDDLNGSMGAGACMP